MIHDKINAHLPSNYLIQVKIFPLVVNRDVLLVHIYNCVTDFKCIIVQCWMVEGQKLFYWSSQKAF